VTHFGPMRYLTDTNVAAMQAGAIWDGQSWIGYGQSLAEIGPGQSYTQSAPIWAGTQYYLFEGSGIGFGELVLRVQRGTNVLAETSAWLDLRDVRDLYERSYITNNTSGAKSNWTSAVAIVEFPAVSWEDESRDIIVYVHGFDNTHWSWINKSDTTFKRLYWAGYHGRFASIRWPCKRFGLDLMAYNDSEFNAYKAGSAMAVYLNQLRGRFPTHRLHILAHSQGAAITSEALSQGAPYDTCILSQGAMPASSYDIDAPLHSGLVNAEAIYGPTPEWRLMGYRGIYTNLTGRIVNFYNTNDSVLAIWINNQGGWKPNLPSTPYTYDGTNGWYDVIFGKYMVTDPQESRAYVSRSRTESVGRTGPESPHGVIKSAIDLKARFGFDDSFPDGHSAQWAWPIQRCRLYYLQVLDSIQP